MKTKLLVGTLALSIGFSAAEANGAPQAVQQDDMPELILTAPMCERMKSPFLRDDGLRVETSGPIDGLSLGFNRLLVWVTHGLVLTGCGDIRVTPALDQVCPPGYEPAEVVDRRNPNGGGWKSLGDFCGDLNTAEPREFDPPIKLTTGTFEEYWFEVFDPSFEQFSRDGIRMTIAPRAGAEQIVQSREINPSYRPSIPRHQQTFAEGFKLCFGQFRATEPGATFESAGGAWIIPEFFGDRADLVCRKNAAKGGEDDMTTPLLAGYVSTSTILGSGREPLEGIPSSTPLKPISEPASPLGSTLLPIRASSAGS